ncbi:transcriptional regulator PhoU [Mycobacterium tuberculosis]|nr:transcriptional regulator PhoU [Mycobacterium tuberculosis]
MLRSLERIGDHARNISELVIYLVRGTDVRHMGLKRMKAEVEGSADLIPNVPGESDDK